jgi:hypothetical protein
MFWFDGYRGMVMLRFVPHRHSTLELVGWAAMPNTLFRQPTKPAQFDLKNGITVLAFGLIGNMDMLGMAAQPTGQIMNREFLSQLQNDLLAIIITLTLTAIVSMLVGYRVIAKRLAQRGMKKEMRKPLGKQAHHLYFC